MPYIKIESGKLSDEQKTLLIERLTETAAEVMKIPQEFFTVTITELPDKNFAGKFCQFACKTFGDLLK